MSVKKFFIFLLLVITMVFTFPSQVEGAATASLLKRIHELTRQVSELQKQYAALVKPKGIAAVSTKFQQCDRVQVTNISSLNVRSGAGTAYPIVGTQPSGAKGTVIDGPVAANSARWWRINYDNAPDGWSIERYLTKIGSLPAPCNDTTPPTASILVPNTNPYVTSSTALSVIGALLLDNVAVTSGTWSNSAVAGAQGSLTASPYGWIASNIPLSTTQDNVITVIARDAAGNTSAPATLTVRYQSGTDTTPPTVSHTTPANGSTVSGTSVTVSANATDNVGVAGVQFTLDGVNLGTEDTTLPYSISWNTTQTTNGSHTLRAVARDAAGNRTTSFAVNVTVSNGTPSPTPSPSPIPSPSPNPTPNPSPSPSPLPSPSPSPTPSGAPNAPTNLTTTLADKCPAGGLSTKASVELRWTDNATNETGYEIERALSPAGFTGTPTYVIGSNYRYYKDTNLLLDTMYYYRVRATKSGVDSANAEINVKTYPADSCAPGQPYNLGATEFPNSSMSLYWKGRGTDNPSSGASGVAYHRVYRNNVPVVETLTEAYVDHGLTPGTEYCYQISTLDAAGNESLKTTPFCKFAKANTYSAGAACTANSKWCWEDPLPQGNNLNAVWGSGTNDVWAVGEKGTILHRVNGTWLQVSSGTTNDLYAIWGTSATNIWAVGDKGTILHWDGVRWAPSPGYTGTSAPFYRISGTGPNDVWTTGGWHWDGTSWTQKTGAGGHAIWAESPTTIWTAAGGGSKVTVRRSTNGGATWPDVAFPAVYNAYNGDLWGSSGNNVYLALEFVGGGLWRWNGSSWSGVNYGGFGSTRDVWGTSASDVWVLPDTNLGAVYHYNGTAWTALPKFIQARGGGSVDPNNVWIVGEQGSIAYWNGKEWSVEALGFPAYINDIWGSASNDVVAVGGSGQVLRWNGSEWWQEGVPMAPASPTNVSQNLYGVWGSSSNDIWAVGSSGIALRRQNSKWSRVSTPTTRTLNDIWGSGESDIWAVGDLGYTMRWNGSSWSTVASATTTAHVFDVWGSSANNVWAVGNYGLAMRWNGNVWQAISTPTNAQLVSVWGSGPNDVYAVSSNNKMIHWNGSVWDPVSIPAPGGWGLFKVWGTSATDVWAVGAVGSAIHWNGSTWSVVPAGTSKGINGMWGSSASDIKIVGDEGLIMRYKP